MAKIRDGKSIGAAKKKPLTKVKVEKEQVVNNQPLAQARQSMLYASRIDAIDKELQLNSALEVQPTLSSGLLSYDLVTGKGLKSGLGIVFGAEGSAKSTAAMTVLGSSLRRDIPMRKYFDAEGAIDRAYTSQILRTDDFSSIFGERGTDGSWTRYPMCRYHDNNIIETVFKSIHRAVSMMPDKIFRPQENMWYLVFERDKEQTTLLKEMMKFYDAEASKKLFTATGKYWLPIGETNDAPQGMVLVDSIPSLIPEQVDEEEISDKSLALSARKLGPWVQRVRGKLRPKGVIMLAVNQLRDNPGAGPGQMPFYEPSGNILKLASDNRCMWTSRVPMDGFPRDDQTKQLGAEPSVEVDGGTDFYAFKGITNWKNKWGTPLRKGRARVWIKDGYGKARGFDPVYDTFVFLDELDLIDGSVTDRRSGKRFRIKLKAFRGVEFTWDGFKAMIIAQEYNDSKLRAKARDMGMPVKINIRNICFNMIKTGRSEELLAKASLKKAAKASSVDLEKEPEADD